MTETEIAALNPAQLRHRVVRKASASILLLVLMVIFSPLKYASALDATFADDRVSHGYTDSNGVKIHFATMGDKSKPLVVMLHGFPDFWFTWRDQMDALSKDYYVVAPDLRGYNLSDKPKGAENYGMAYLIGDLAAVIRAQGREKAVVIGHDWGGAVAWFTAMSEPQLVEKLILLNMPHPRALRRELATNQKQAARIEYARQFQRSGADARLDPERLFSWVRDSSAKKEYVNALNRSDTEAMLNYYKQNFPKEPYTQDTSPVVKVQVPVLMIHGLNDEALDPSVLDGTWNYVARNLTLLTIPDAGHFVQQDASAEVTRTIRTWLSHSRPER